MTLFELLQRFTTTDQFDKACSIVGKTQSFHGFRKGKTPIQVICSVATTNIKTQRQISMAIGSLYFPDRKPNEILLESFEISNQDLGGYIAAYIGQQREADFPFSIDELKKELIRRTNESEEGKQSENEKSDSSDPSESLTADTDSVQEYDESETTPMMMIGENSEGIDTPIVNNEMMKENGGTKMQYLGYVHVVPADFRSFSYYNFYPIATIDENREVSILEYSVRKSEFPEYGNIQITSSNRDDAHLDEMLYQGAIIVLDLTEVEKKLNYKQNRTQLNQTNYKVDIEDLEFKNAIHAPSEYGLYPVISIQEVESSLKEDKLIRISIQSIDVPYDQHVVLKSEAGSLFGPFVLSYDSNDSTYYINPQSKKNNYLFGEYRSVGLSDEFINIERPSSGYTRAPSVDITYANVNRMGSHIVDFIPKEALVQELGRILDARNEEESTDTVESAFAGINLPDDIAANRRTKLLGFFAELSSLNDMTGALSEVMNKLLINAARTNREQFDDVFKVLADDSKFLLRIQRYRRIAEAILSKEAELEKINVEYQEILKKKDESEQQFESQRTAVLTEGIQVLQSQLDGLNARIIEKTTELGLVEDIHKLMVQRDVQNELIQQAKKEYDEIHIQIQIMLEKFRNDVKEPMAQIAHVVLNDEVAAIVNAATDRAHAKKENDSIKLTGNLVVRIKDACDKAITSEELVDMLCARIKKHRSYEKNEIINLFLCMTQGFLTVFSGAPGTGKTSVCNILAHALGLDYSVKIEEEADDLQGYTQSSLNRYVVVPVERGWSSKRDFVGYYNPLTKAFDKANSAIYQALEVSDIEAKNDDGIHMPPSVIMLDEANLSPMEYYWADFMSACDDYSENTVITLSEKDSFRVAKSLRFLATINNDHTTESLSPRLIDRAWVISLPQPNSPRITCFDEYYQPVSMELMKKVFDTQIDTAVLDPESESILKKIFDYCREKLNTNVSPRSELAIRKYCIVGSGLFESSKSGVDGPIVALDYAVAQKILPKIQGSGAVYRSKLEELKEELMRDNLIKSSEALNRIIQKGDRNMQYYQYFA